MNSTQLNSTSFHRYVAEVHRGRVLHSIVQSMSSVAGNRQSCRFSQCAGFNLCYANVAGISSWLQTDLVLAEAIGIEAERIFNCNTLHSQEKVGSEFIWVIQRA